MFVQVIQGKAKDAAGLRKERDRWVEELMPGATGFLGSTSGVAEDGRFIAVARFESEEAARRNSDRPEQGAWWAGLLTHLDGEPTVHDCREADLFAGGGSDDAGFVQVMQGEVLDLDKLMKMRSSSERWLKENRPDFIGSVYALHGDGGFTEVAYFTSESEAREGEKKMNEEAEALTQDWEEAARVDTYIDLPDPWLVTK